MIVLDASIVVELLTRGALAEAIESELADSAAQILAPHVLDVEVVSAIRVLAAGRRLDAHRVGELLGDLESLAVERYSHVPQLGRMWELRHNFTAYDAAYIALAEATGATLYTTDAKLSKGHRARVRLFRLN